MAGHTTKLGLWYPDGTDPISSGDDGLRENANLLDADVGPLVKPPYIELRWLSYGSSAGGGDYPVIGVPDEINQSADESYFTYNSADGLLTFVKDGIYSVSMSAEAVSADATFGIYLADPTGYLPSSHLTMPVGQTWGGINGSWMQCVTAGTVRWFAISNPSPITIGLIAISAVRIGGIS